MSNTNLSTLTIIDWWIWRHQKECEILKNVVYLCTLINKPPKHSLGSASPNRKQLVAFSIILFELISVYYMVNFFSVRV